MILTTFDLDEYVYAALRVGARGFLLKNASSRLVVEGVRAAAAVGAPGLHFHDLRHTDNTLAAQTGASLRDLMTRMGHDSPRAALIYRHASAGAERAIADALDVALRHAREE